MNIDDKPQTNYAPIDLEINQSSSEPQVNTPNTAPSESNITPVADSSILSSGSFQSPNFKHLDSGWKIDAAGNAEFNGTIIAGGYTQVFRQASIPTSLHINDIWIDTDDSNKMYVAASVGATTIGVGQWVLTNPAAAWSTLIDDDGNKPDNNATVGAIFGTNISGGGTGNTQVSNSGFTTLYRQDKFGDGADGDITIAVDTILTADTYCNNLTVNSGKVLDTGGYRLFVKSTLTNNGIIKRTPNAGGNGGNSNSSTIDQTGGAAGTAGAALADGSIKGALAGVAGVAGATGVIGVGSSGASGNNGSGGSSSGTSVNKSLVGYDGKSGVNGGAGGGVSGSSITSKSGGSGGSGAAGGSRSGTVYNTIRNAFHALMLYDFLPSGEQLKSAPSNGGSGSGGTGGANGQDASDLGRSAGGGGSGGGGSNGGIVVIFAKNIVNTSGIISAEGGNGGQGGTPGASSKDHGGGHELHQAAAGGSGGGGGGVGGNGGVLILVYESLAAGTETAAGGVGGAGGTGANGVGDNGATGANGSNGTTGSNGNDGVVIKLQV